MVHALLVHLDMRVAEQQRRTLRELRHAIRAVMFARAKDMPMGAEQLAAVVVQNHGTVGHAREGEHHLIDLGLAIAAHGDEAPSRCQTVQ